jgi:SSS family solute:Na+ symporter
MSFGAVDALILVVYLVGNLILGYLMSRRVHTAMDFQIGDRSAPWWAIGISVIATYVSALSFLGGPAWAYNDGMAALAIHVNYPLVIFAVVSVFLPFFYNSGVASIYEYLERRFGLASRTVMSILFLFTQTVTTASILTATAVVITFVTGIDPRLAIVLTTMVVLAYTMLGGMNAVIWTDVLQAAILFVGAAIVLYALIETVGPLSVALQTLASAGKLNPLRTELDFSAAPTLWSGVFAMTLFHITVYGANQMMVQRALAARTIGDAKKSYMMMGFAGFFIYFLFFFIGALLFVHFDGRGFAQPNEIILVFADSLAIPGLMGLLVAAILSASMSTLSSALNSLATISVTDFYQRFARPDADDRQCLALSRLLTVVWAAVSIPIAFQFIDSRGSILERLTEAASYFVGAKLAMFGLGFLSKHTTERGLLVGVVAGFLGLYVSVAGIPFLEWSPPPIAWPWYVVIGGGINIGVSWLASILLDGFQAEWHPQTVPGQRRRFRERKLDESQDGWYRVPGRIDRPLWALPAYFALTLALLTAFAKLGSG